MGFAIANGLSSLSLPGLTRQSSPFLDHV